jgi:hypothetical protein
MTSAVLCALAGCGDGGGSGSTTGDAGPPPPPSDAENLFKKPGPKGAPKPAPKGAFLVEPGARPVLVG